MGVRMQRVSRLLQREIADIIAREVEESHMITVTEARVTRDLSIVNVFVSVFGKTPEQRQLSFKQLTRQTAGCVAVWVAVSATSFVLSRRSGSISMTRRRQCAKWTPFLSKFKANGKIGASGDHV